MLIYSEHLRETVLLFFSKSFEKTKKKSPERPNQMAQFEYRSVFS